MSLHEGKGNPTAGPTSNVAQGHGQEFEWEYGTSYGNRSSRMHAVLASAVATDHAPCAFLREPAGESEARILHWEVNCLSIEWTKPRRLNEVTA